MNARIYAIVLLPLYVLAAAFAFADSGSADAVATIIQGTAKVFSKGDPSGKALKQGDHLLKDDEVRVAEKSKVELRFADGTVMRLAEKSALKMSDLAFNKTSDTKTIKVGLGVGRLWAKVKKLSNKESSVEVATANAVAGVRGTVYRLNVEEDQSAVVKVYDGAVSVASPPQSARKSAASYVAPHQVPGPHAVAPPHEVTLEAWTVIVKAMQQVSISAAGVASKPQDFDAKSDADDWVKWNQELDQAAAGE